jgi:hypothetical protein
VIIQDLCVQRDPERRKIVKKLENAGRGGVQSGAMKFVLIDKIVELDSGKRIRAVKKRVPGGRVSGGPLSDLSGTAGGVIAGRFDRVGLVAGTGKNGVWPEYGLAGTGPEC